MNSKMGHVRSKTRLLGQMIEEFMLVTKGCDLNPCHLMLYHSIQKAQVRNTMAIMALLSCLLNKNYIFGRIFVKLSVCPSHQ